MLFAACTVDLGRVTVNSNDTSFLFPLGGFVSELLAEKLSKGLLGYDVNRYCDPVQFPSHAVNGPIVLIVDENTSSGERASSRQPRRPYLMVNISFSSFFCVSNHFVADGDVLANTFQQMRRGTVVGKVWEEQLANMACFIEPYVAPMLCPANLCL